MRELTGYNVMDFEIDPDVKAKDPKASWSRDKGRVFSSTSTPRAPPALPTTMPSTTTTATTTSTPPVREWGCLPGASERSWGKLSSTGLSAVVRQEQRPHPTPHPQCPRWPLLPRICPSVSLPDNFFP